MIDRESNRSVRWIKETLWIRKSTHIMNQDEGHRLMGGYSIGFHRVVSMDVLKVNYIHFFSDYC